MNVLRVQAEGFRCYDRLDWRIPEGASAILGTNGSGKTSRLQAIEVGLYADRGELGSPGVLKSGCDSCMVTVEVEHEGEVYRVRRSFSKGRTTCDFERRIGGGDVPAPGDISRGRLVVEAEHSRLDDHDASDVGLLRGCEGQGERVRVRDDSLRLGGAEGLGSAGGVQGRDVPSREGSARRNPRVGPGGWEPLSLASIAETDALIVRTLGMNRQIFRAVVILGQGALALASKSLTPKQRMDMFVHLVRLDIYPRLAKAAHDQLATVNAEHAVAYQRHTDALEQAAGKDEHARLSAEHDQAAQEAQQKLAAAQKLQETLRDQFTTARDKTQAVETARAAVTVAEGEHRRLNDKTVAANEAREQLPALDAEHTRLTEIAAPLDGLIAHETELRAECETHKRLTETYQARVGARASAQTQQQDLLSRAALATDENGRLVERARQVLANLGEPCDRCHRPLGQEDAERAAASYRAEARAKSHEVMRLRNEAAAIVLPDPGEPPADEPPTAQLAQAQTLVQEARNAQHELAALTERRNTLLQKITQADDSSFLAAMKDAVDAVEAAREALRVAQAAAPDPTAVMQIKMDGLAASAAANEAQQALTHATSEKARADERLAVATAAEERATNLAAGLAALTERAATLEHAKTCLGTYAPSIVIENTVPRIESDFADNINTLGGPTTGTRVEFRTQKENKSGTVADRLDVVFVTPDGHDRLYDDWSTGERLRLSLALARAIVPNLDLLIIDDPPGLDQEGKAAMVDTIHALVHQGAVRSVVVVSQEAELRDSFDVVLELGAAEPAELVTA